MTPVQAAETSTAGAAPPEISRLPRHLGTWNAALVMVTATIGVGILQSPGVVAAKTGGIALSYMAWVVGAIAAACGSLVMAELAVRTPRSGGSTVYLHEAFGPRVAFMFGWTSMLFNPCATAAITLVSVRNLGAILNLSEVTQSALRFAWVGGITVLGMRSSRVVARIVGGAGVFKISALIAVVALCFVGDRSGPVSAAAAAPAIASPWVSFGLAVIATMFAYDGWDYLALVAGEVRQPARTLPRATFLGIILVLAVYLSVNTGFFYALPFGEMATNPALVATAVGHVIGENTGKFVTIFVSLSAACTVFSILLCQPRVIFALAEEGQFFRAAAYVHPRWKTPLFAIAINGLITLLYIASGSGFERLTRYMILGFLPFYGLVAIAAVMARRRAPPSPGQYSMPLYPLPVVLMLAYVVCGLASGLAGDFVASAVGLATIGAGAIVYEVWHRIRRTNTIAPAPGSAPP